MEASVLSPQNRGMTSRSAARSHASRSAPPRFSVPAPECLIPARVFFFLLKGPLWFAPDLIFVPVLSARRTSVFSFEALGTLCSLCQFDFLVLCSIDVVGAQRGVVF
jgi:hypothetical protein